MNGTKTERFARALIGRLRRFRWPFLALTLALLALATWLAATKIRINSDLSSLLPKDTPSVLALQEVNERFGASDKFMLVIQSDSALLVADLQDSLKRVLDAEWKDILVSAQIDQPTDFFAEHALLYLPVRHLERVRDNLATLQRRMGAKGPLTVDLTGEGEKEEEELVWFDSDIPQELGLPDEAADAFNDFTKLVRKDSARAEKDPSAAAWDPKACLPPRLKARLIGQHEEDKTINGVVLCKLTGSATDLDFTKLVLARTDSLLDRFRGRDWGTTVHFGVAGSYEGLEDVEAMQQDGLVSTVISTVLLLGMMIVFFRGWAALLAMFNVANAAMLMLGFTAVSYGELNPFTLFVAAIILGMGIDYSIHFLGTAQRLRAEGRSVEDALVGTVLDLFKPMSLACLTTVAGMLTLLAAKFRGFYEFGAIASVGVFISYVSAFTVLPLLVLCIGRLPAAHPFSVFPKRWTDGDVAKFLKKATAAAAAATVVLACFAPWCGFENDFRKLRAARSASADAGPNFHTGVAQGGKRTSSQPVVVLGDTREELDALYDTLMVRLHVDRDPVLKSFLTLKTFVPPAEEQEERLEVIEEIAELISARAFDHAEGEERELVDKLREMSKVEAFSPEDLPDWALNLLKERDGSYGKIGFIYGKFESWNALAAEKFQDRYGNWTFGGRQLRSFSSSFTFSDVVRAVRQDSAKLALLMAAVLLLTLLFSLDSRRKALLAFGSLVLGSLWTVGVMGILSLTMDLGRFSVYNIIVIPLALGVGIDSSIHLLSGMERLGLRNLRRLYDTVGQMVVASSLTTVGGFVGVLFIGHHGMRTIGELAVVAISCTLLTALVFVPAVGRVILRKEIPEIGPEASAEGTGREP